MYVKMMQIQLYITTLGNFNKFNSIENEPKLQPLIRLVLTIIKMDPCWLIAFNLKMILFYNDAYCTILWNTSSYIL